MQESLDPVPLHSQQSEQMIKPFSSSVYQRGPGVLMVDTQSISFWMRLHNRGKSLDYKRLMERIQEASRVERDGGHIEISSWESCHAWVAQKGKFELFVDMLKRFGFETSLQDPSSFDVDFVVSLLQKADRHDNVVLVTANTRLESAIEALSQDTETSSRNIWIVSFADFFRENPWGTLGCHTIMIREDWFFS